MSNGLIILVTLLIPSIVTADVVCPPPASIEPCGCSEDSGGYGEDGTSIALSCARNLLGDVRISEILEAFLNTPSVSPVSVMHLNSNLLTRIPPQLPKFTQLSTISLDRNFILSFPSNAFNFTRPPKYLWLNNNRLNGIEAGAFQGNYGNLTFIFLYANELTRFPSNVFQSVMEQMMRFGGHPNAYIRLDQNPIDCEINPCHLAWLIRDNRNLLPAVYLGQCSNGTAFEDLDPNGYSDCPTIATDPTPTFTTPQTSGSRTSLSSNFNLLSKYITLIFTLKILSIVYE